MKNTLGQDFQIILLVYNMAKQPSYIGSKQTKSTVKREQHNIESLDTLGMFYPKEVIPSQPQKFCEL